jgi:hypothetical protein
MGLDIIVLKNAIPCEANDAGESVHNANGFDRMDGRLEGRYTGERFMFSAGSYGNYNQWRTWLSKTFLGVFPETVWENRARYQGKPFYELIDFGDNEGAIGPETSAKLAKDFETNRVAVDLMLDQYQDEIEMEWNHGKFVEWQKAFEMASEDGFILFQ